MSEDEISELFCSFSSSSGNDSFHSVSVPLVDSVNSCFSGFHRNFNVVHINAQSVPCHYPDLLASFDVQNLHAILISESFLKPVLPSSFYPLPGFHLIRNDREGKGGGGVAIYLRSHIPYKVISTSPSQYSGSVEYLFLEVVLSHTKVLLGVVYSPNKNIDYFPTFENVLETLCPTYLHTIILGDFNTCLKKNDSRSKILTSIVESANLHILPSGTTHHFPGCEPSLLDLKIVSSPDHVDTHGQLSADAFSYHDLVYVSYRIRPPKPKPKTMLQRNFRDMDTDVLREDAAGLNWDVIFEADSVDHKIETFNSLLTHLYDRHAPVRCIHLKHLPAPWLTPELRDLMAKKATAKAKYKFNATARNLDRYKYARNRCNTACRDAQRRHIHSSIENGDPMKVWKFLGTLGIGKTRQDLPTDIDIDALNHHFTTNSTSFDGATKSRTLAFLSNSPPPPHNQFSFSPVVENDVKKQILSITSNAVGTDDISRKMILPLIDVVLPYITHIFNFSLSSKVFPNSWKLATVVPLPKNNKPSSFSHYRPISILPFLSKVMERLVHQQLSLFLQRNNLLNELQSGFRPGHSTVTALIKVTDDIRFGMSQQKVTLLTLLDFSNAFNTVDFDVLLALLKSLNLSSSATEWLRSYLTGRRQRVKVDEKSSNWSDILSGVPQGCVLSPLLFSLFINSISNSLKCSYHLYADDLQLYTQDSAHNIHKAIATMNHDLEEIASWTASYGLTVNPGKSQTIIIGSARQLTKIDSCTLPSVLFMGTPIPFCDVVKNLGVFFDRTLSWSRHVGEVSRKIFASMKSLKRLRNFLPIRTKVQLAQSLLHPILDYADACYLDANEVLLNKLERIQNMCIRFIFGLRKYDHVSEYRARLRWLPIRLRRNLHLLSLLFNILHNPCTPPYLKNRFSFRSSVHGRIPRPCTYNLLVCPIHTTEFYSNSFTVQAVRLWNSLPPSIRQAQSLPAFKNLLRRHYESQCGYTDDR